MGGASTWMDHERPTKAGASRVWRGRRTAAAGELRNKMECPAGKVSWGPARPPAVAMGGRTASPVQLSKVQEQSKWTPMGRRLRRLRTYHQSPGEAAAAAWPSQQWLRELGATCWSFLLLTRKVPGMAQKALLPHLLPVPQEELPKGVSTNWEWQFPNKQVT